MNEYAQCLFCDRDNLQEHVLIIENDFCYARWDKFPVAPGHCEVIPKKHIVSFFDVSDDDSIKLFILLKEVRNIVQEKFNPDGFTIGINEGEAAGRTIHHLHIHLIPRYRGDVENPRGGVRNVIPGKGSY